MCAGRVIIPYSGKSSHGVTFHGFAVGVKTKTTKFLYDLLRTISGYGFHDILKFLWGNSANFAPVKFSAIQ